ncbi:MAG: glycogen phosphorylase, partial [Bryobacteraceae bacterium]
MATVVSTTSAQKHEYTRTGLSVESLKRAFIDNLIYEQGKYPELATKLDYYMAIASSVRDRLLQRWVDTVATYRQQDVRVVCYLSAEYLLGPQLEKNLFDLGIKAEA